jgi:hypothetical protein
MATTPNKSLRNIPIIRPLVFQTDEVDEANEFALRNGYALIQVHDTRKQAKKFSREVVREVWGGIVEDMALRPDLLKRLIENGYTITDDASIDRFMGRLPAGFIRGLYAILGENVFLHSGFGAPASNRAFNLRVLWLLRQNEMLDKFSQRFLQTDDVMTSIDRPICKLHGKGDQEFLHLDRKPFSAPSLESFSGKYCTSESSFIAVPESHLWCAEIKEQYSEHYPRRTGDKWGICPLKPDPLELFEKAVKIIVPAHCMILWLPDLIHGVVKNMTGHIAFGLYVGFTKNIERKEYEKTHNVAEVVDRFNVYKKGVAPKGFPSMDKVQLYPLRFKNFHQNIGAFVDKMDKTSEHYCFDLRKLSKRDEWVPHLTEIEPKNYVPPVTLSQRGRELLVGKKRVREFFDE